MSPITASRFFRNPEALSLSKRERVDSAAKELGYVPNLAARALASHRTEVIGVVIPSLTNNVFSDVLRGIYDASEGSRYSIQLANTRYSILQEEKLLRLFRAQKPAGLIVTGINQTAESRAILESMNCPIVQIMEIGDTSGRHDGRLLALRRELWRRFRTFSRKAAGASDFSAREWIPACSGGSKATATP